MRDIQDTINIDEVRFEMRESMRHHRGTRCVLVQCISINDFTNLRAPPVVIIDFWETREDNDKVDIGGDLWHRQLQEVRWKGDSFLR